MNLTDAEQLELQALCSAVVDGALSPTERSRLESLLASSAEARREYVRIISLSASLHGFAAEMQADAPMEPQVIKLNETWKWWITPAVLSLAAALALGLWIHYSPSTQTREAGTELALAGDTSESIARISGLKDCAWIGAASSPGDTFTKDQVLKIASGLAEITFDSGARLILEGPATLAVRSAWEAELLHGSLKAEVPQEAIGFRLVHAAVNVIDLGTEFTMTAEDNGEAEVLVLKGSVEATSRQTKGTQSERVLLNEQQGRRFAKSGMSEMRLREQKFAKWSRKLQIDRPAKPTALAHWSFDQLQNKSYAVRSSGRISGTQALNLVSTSGAPPNEAGKEGRWQQGLQLDGHSFATTPLPQFNAKSPRTVAFWLKIPADASPLNASPALAWSATDGSARTELSWNTTPGHGTFGALRMNTPHGYLVGSTPLRDGQWHHVAVILNHTTRKSDHLQITLYLDGRLESLTARTVTKRGSHDALMKTGTLWLGRSSSTTGDTAAFRGALDELVITDRALAPEDVRMLMRSNALSPQGADMF